MQSKSGRIWIEKRTKVSWAEQIQSHTSYSSLQVKQAQSVGLLSPVGLGHRPWLTLLLWGQMFQQRMRSRCFMGSELWETSDHEASPHRELLMLCRNKRSLKPAEDLSAWYLDLGNPWALQLSKRPWLKSFVVVTVEAWCESSEIEGERSS